MIMSRARDTFETIVPNAQQKLIKNVLPYFPDVDPTIENVLPVIIDDHKTKRDGWVYCMGIGFPCSQPIDDDFPGFPFPGPPPMPSPPDCPGRQRKINGVCQDPGPTPPQDPDPPPPKPIVPPHPLPNPLPCTLVEFASSGCLGFNIDAVMTVRMKSTDILANYVALGGPTESIVNSMTGHCGDRHPSGIASDDSCLFTGGVAKNFSVDIIVSNSGDCAARKAADDNAIKKYIDAGGSVVSTVINGITSTPTTGDGNANCIGDLKGSPSFDDIEIVIPDGFYVSYDYDRMPTFRGPGKDRLSYGWIQGGSYFVDSPAFKTKGVSNQYLTNFRLGSCIEGFHGKGDFQYTAGFPNYFLKRSINTYNIKGQRIYYSGSPLSDSDPYDGYTVEGLGTTSSPLKVNWVPFSKARSFTPKIYTAVYSTAKDDWGNRGVYQRRNKDLHRHADRSAHLIPRFITVNQKGTLIVRIHDSVGPNKNVKAAMTYTGTNNIGKPRHPLYVTSSPTKQHFVGEYKSVSFDLTSTFPLDIFGRQGYMLLDFMQFNHYDMYASPIAISGYEISVTPILYAENF